MNRGSRTARVTFCLGVALTSLAADCDTRLTEQGCLVKGRSRQFDEGTLEYIHAVTEACPIPIAAPGEYVDTGGDLYDYTADFTETSLRIANSLDRTVYLDVVPPEYFSTGSSVFHLYANYPAATGQNRVGDSDFFIARLSSLYTSGSGYLELQLETRQVQSFTLNIAGPNLPYANTTQSWSASGSGGTAPLRYDWYREEDWTAAGGTYTANTGTSNFALRVVMTDANQRSASRMIQVRPDGVAVGMTGPSLVYPDQGGTWTAANATGGYPPYRYEWHVDGRAVGTASSYTRRYWSAGSRAEIRLQIFDTRGKTAGVTRLISVLGDEDCTPQPPARTCAY